MNLKLWASASAVAVATVFAQDYTQDVFQDAPAAEPAPVVEEASAPAPAPAAEPAPASAPAAPAPVAAVETPATAPAVSGNLMAKIDVLRGNAYNSVGNELAATTVSDQLAWPYLMAIGQFLYVEPTNNKGYVAFNKGLTFYGGLDNSGTVGLLTAGIATPSFGFGIDIGLSKSFLTESPSKGDETKTTTINPGDDVGLTFAMPIGAYALSIQADWLTMGNEISTEQGDAELENDLWQLSLAAAFSNSPSASTFGWTLGAQVLRNEETTETEAGGKTVKVTSPNSRIEIDPYFNFATQILGNDMARVLIGSNNMFAVQLFDKGDAAGDGNYKKHTEFGLQLTPNVWADVALTDNWLVFGGISQNILLFGLEMTTDAADTEDTMIQLHSSETTAQLGFRFQWKMLAVEASVEDVIYRKTFAAAFNGEDIVANMGFFLNF
jgi:hypothetical protein